MSARRYTKEPWIARHLRERYGHVRTTGHLISLLEETLAEHRLGNTPNSTQLTLLLALIIDHLWIIPNTPTPVALIASEQDGASNDTDSEAAA